MDPVPPAAEASPLVRYGFAVIFTVACLHNLELGVRIAGVFLMGMALYEGFLGRVPMMGAFTWKTTSYLKGPAAIAVIAIVMMAGAFCAFTPGVVMSFLARYDSPS
jgi:hypothetical protein